MQFNTTVISDLVQEKSMVLLVGVPVMVLLVMSMAACGLVFWLRTKRQHRILVDHKTSMIKVPIGGDPTYGVRNNSSDLCCCILCTMCLTDFTIVNSF